MTFNQTLFLSAIFCESGIERSAVEGLFDRIERELPR
jgi:hypothetical protein